MSEPDDLEGLKTALANERAAHKLTKKELGEKLTAAETQVTELTAANTKLESDFSTASKDLVKYTSVDAYTSELDRALKSDKYKGKFDVPKDKVLAHLKALTDAGGFNAEKVKESVEAGIGLFATEIKPVTSGMSAAGAGQGDAKVVPADPLAGLILQAVGASA